MRKISMMTTFLAFMTFFGLAQLASQPASQSAGKTITPPKQINKIELVFSNEALAKNINGRCIGMLAVGVDGIPQNIQLIRCSDPVFAKGFEGAVGKFRYTPATLSEGKPIPVKITVELLYRRKGAIDPPAPVHYEFNPPPGVTSSGPGADGVYPLTKSTTPPVLDKFSDEGYGEAAFIAAGNSACDIVFTINAKGKASNPQVSNCEGTGIEKPAVQSLLKSHFKPGSVNGLAVPIRTSIHLEYGNIPPKS